MDGRESPPASDWLEAAQYTRRARLREVRNLPAVCHSMADMERRIACEARTCSVPLCTVFVTLRTESEDQPWRVVTLFDVDRWVTVLQRVLGSVSAEWRVCLKWSVLRGDGAVERFTSANLESDVIGLAVCPVSISIACRSACTSVEVPAKWVGSWSRRRCNVAVECRAWDSWEDVIARAADADAPKMKGYYEAEVRTSVDPLLLTMKEIIGGTCAKHDVPRSIRVNA